MVKRYVPAARRVTTSGSVRRRMHRRCAQIGQAESVCFMIHNGRRVEGYYCCVLLSKKKGKPSAIILVMTKEEEEKEKAARVIFVCSRPGAGRSSSRRGLDALDTLIEHDVG